MPTLQPIDPALAQLGAFLRRRRARAGRTIENLADRIGCTPERLHAIEAGEESPSERVLIEFIVALDISPGDLHHVIAQVAAHAGPYQARFRRTEAAIMASPRMIRATRPMPGTHEAFTDALHRGNPDAWRALDLKTL